MKIIQPLVYAVLISIGIFIGNISNSENNEHENKIDNILKIIDNHYVDSINYSDFENKTINTFLNELDPHSSYISVNDYKAIEEDMNGSFSGIGVEFNIIEDSIVVISPIEGGPSQKLGIKSGDRIITVEDEDVASIGVKNENVIKLLRGEKGSEVNVKIKRRGTKDPILFKIIRDDIPLVSVSAGILLDDKIGYVKINRFAATTFNEMNKKCNKLINQGMEKLILDFRGNPGGYLHISNQICDEFLKDGELIVFTEGRNRERDEIYATSNGELEDIDIICLIDEGSASASEIVSGAIQDNDRGLIIGRRSFGKGLFKSK
jgi:carboxyl-terminal processing protease